MIKSTLYFTKTLANSVPDAAQTLRNGLRESWKAATHWPHCVFLSMQSRMDSNHSGMIVQVCWCRLSGFDLRESYKTATNWPHCVFLSMQAAWSATAAA
jgi:hypothetical protein